jgi:hypothetical protein
MQLTNRLLTCEDHRNTEQGCTDETIKGIERQEYLREVQYCGR